MPRLSIRKSAPGRRCSSGLVSPAPDGDSASYVIVLVIALQFSVPRLLLLLFVAVSGLAGCRPSVEGTPRKPSVPEHATVWAMLNVCPAEAQADCHLLVFPDGTRYLVDAADASDAPGVASAALIRRGVTELDTIVISHFHKDHYGRLRDLIEAGIRVGRVVGTVPHPDVAASEKHWIHLGGCDWNHIEATLAFLRQRGIPFLPAVAGMKLYERTVQGSVVTLEVLVAYDGMNTPIGQTSVNDTSVILRLSHGPTRALFTGDLDERLGAWLVGSDVDLKADLLKAPHHGTEGLPSNEFFSKVAAKYVLVPSPKALWFSPRSARTRNYFADAGVPVRVSGLDGDVDVILTAQGYSVVSEHDRP